MHSLNDTALENNKYMKINFDGGDLSSDTGLLLVKEFTCKLGFDIMRQLRKVVYAIKEPQVVLLDLDSTLLDTYGHQEAESFNLHYQDHGYHPLVCYDGITGDLPKIELRNGTDYSVRNILA